MSARPPAPSPPSVTQTTTPASAKPSGSEDVQSYGPRPTIFQEDWWLQAASGGRIETVEIRWDAVVVASLSFMRHSKAGFFCSLGAPRYTHTLGPVISLPPSRPTTHALNLQRVVRELRLKLPSHDRFRQYLDPDSEAAFAFSLAGCSLGQVFTFRIDAAQDPSDVLARIDPPVRRLIKAGSKRLSVQEHQDIDRFLRTMVAEGRSLDEDRHDVEDLRRICVASFARERGTFLSVLDEAGEDLATVLLVWDDRVLYYLIPFRSRLHAKGGANAYLIYEAIKFSLAKGLIFDFDGYSSLGSARFLSSFGARPIVRPIVSYRSPRCVLLDFARGFRRRGDQAGLPFDMDVPVSTENVRLPRSRPAKSATSDKP